MAQYYERTRKGSSPVSLDEMKLWLKVPPTVTADDDLIQLLLDAATDYAEKYTSRDVRVNRWKLFLDEFPARICVRRDPVDSIVAITRLVSGTATAVPTATYYLKSHTQFSEVLLSPDQDWPTDQDVGVEHSIEVEVETRAVDCLDQIVAGIYRHVAYLYENRGDCPPELVFNRLFDSVFASGAARLYDLRRIARI